MANKYQSLSTLQYVILGDKTYYVLESGVLQEIKEASSIIKALLDIYANPHKLLFISSSVVSGTTIKAVLVNSMLRNALIQCNSSLTLDINKLILSSLSAECISYINANTLKNILTSSSLSSISNIILQIQKNMYSQLLIANTSNFISENCIVFYHELLIDSVSDTVNYPLKYSHHINYDTIGKFSFKDLMHGLIVLGTSVVNTYFNSISNIVSESINSLFKNSEINSLSKLIADYINRTALSLNIESKSFINAILENIASVNSIIKSVSNFVSDNILCKYSDVSCNSNSYVDNLPLSLNSNIPYEILNKYKYEDLMNGLLIKISYIMNESLNSSSSVFARLINLITSMLDINSSSSLSAEYLNKKHTKSTIISYSSINANTTLHYFADSIINSESIVFNLPFRYGDSIPYEFLVKYTYDDLYKGRLHLRKYIENTISSHSDLSATADVTNVVLISSKSTLTADCTNRINSKISVINCKSSLKAKAHTKKNAIKGKVNIEINKKYKVVVQI